MSTAPATYGDGSARGMCGGGGKILHNFCEGSCDAKGVGEASKWFSTPGPLAG